MTLAAFVSVALIHLLAAISPGPSFVVSVRTAVTQGFRPAAGLALGLGIGAAVWATGALAGLALLFKVAPPALVALKLAGAAFLVWLAITMWRHADRPLPVAAAAAPPGLARAIRLGLATQLANPKPAVFFGAVFIGLVPPDTPLALRIALLAVIFVDETLWYVLVARMFSSRQAQVVYGRLKRGIDRVFGGLMLALAVKMAVS
ncbi:MAG: LysE family transporter [Rhodobacteraceae bacterium]|nr:LysE family transporter [Paracoccaceae bacterium]